MNLNMVAYSDIGHMSVPEKLFTYAESYLTAATIFCRQLVTDNSVCTWSNGAVVLMLAAHSVELFLKGAILQGNREASVWGHDLDTLASDFHREFKATEFMWDIPFKTTYLSSVEDAEIRALKSQTPQPSILYRYPVGRGGADWQGAYGFEPHSFLLVLESVKTDFTRIRSLLIAPTGTVSP